MAKNMDKRRGKNLKRESKDARKEKNPFKLDKSEKQLRIIVFLLIAVVIIIFAFIIHSYLSNNFNYHGIEFKKSYQGEIVFYNAQIPLKDYYGKIIAYDSNDFRSDPRKLEDIPVLLNYTNNRVQFIMDKKVYVSTNMTIKTCEGYTGVALISQSRFLRIFGIEVKGAFDDPSYANSTTFPYVNCKTNPDNTVIIVKDGSENKIEQTSQNCYEITFKDCDVLKAVEKFELFTLEQYIKG